ncbi:MAG: hypothetical protein N2Z22_06610 [Turneriella sp.]|nr:hypothetical protein [Turneriella sp.]
MQIRTSGLWEYLQNLSNAHIFWLGVAIWLALQSIAIAYSRCHADLIASRYEIIYALIFPLIFVFNGKHFGELAIKWRYAAIAAIMLGLSVRLARDLRHMLRGHSENIYAMESLKLALRANDKNVLAERSKNGSIGYFTADRIWYVVKESPIRDKHLWRENLL